MKYLVLAGMAMLALSGCTMFSTKVAPTIAKGVQKYCLEPYQGRLLIRQQVNSMITPNSVVVHCEGDPDEPVSQ